MEEIYDMLKMPEKMRKDYRKALKGITPTILFNIGIFETIDKLEKLNISRYPATGIAYACIVRERSKTSLFIFEVKLSFYIL